MPDNDNPQGGNPAEALQKLLDKKNGDAMGVAMMLLSENFEYREKNRELRKQIPAEGSVVVPKADADELTVYRELGKSAELKARLEAHATIETELASTKREAAIRDAAELAGYKPSVLKAIAGDTEFLTKEVDEDGKKVRKPFVKIKEGNADVEKPLAEHAEAHWQEFMPSLKVAGQKSGTTLVSMAAGGKATADNVYDKIRQDAKKKQEEQGQAGDPLKERFGLVKTA